MLYKDGNLLVQTLPSSQLNLNGTLHLVASFQGFRLIAAQAQVTGTESFELDVQAQAAASESFAGSLPLITPIHQLYGGFIGPVPVWIDVEFEVNAGYTADFSASAEITDGINGVKTISVGRNWAAAGGWADIYDSPPASLNLLLLPGRCKPPPTCAFTSSPRFRFSSKAWRAFRLTWSLTWSFPAAPR